MSLNEIEALVRRGALGRGLPHGLAEEAGAAAGWLAAAGLDDGRAIADALDGVREGCAGVGANCACWDDSAAGPAAVACIGPSIIDRLALPGFEALTFRLDVPLVLVGMVGARRSELATPLQIRWAAETGGEVRVLLDADLIMIAASDPDAVSGPRDGRVTVMSGLGELALDVGEVVFAPADLERNRRRAIEHGLTLGREPAARIGRHAAKSLVPSSGVSRETGAGAGLVDQD